jgi:hypothetical protein
MANVTSRRVETAVTSIAIHESHINGIDDGDSDSDIDDITVIVLDEAIENIDSANGVSSNWIDQNGPEMEERRLRILLPELKRIQRESFIRFAIMFSIPIVLLVIVLAMIPYTNNESCESDIVLCRIESRKFKNGFKGRCICDPIPTAKTIIP